MLVFNPLRIKCCLRNKVMYFLPQPTFYLSLPFPNVQDGHIGRWCSMETV